MHRPLTRMHRSFAPRGMQRVNLGRDPLRQTMSALLVITQGVHIPLYYTLW